MKRQLDADGYDITDEVGQRRSRLPVVLVGVGSAVVITASAGLVAYTLTRPVGGSEHTARAAEARVVTSLGHVVTGDAASVDAARPVAQSLFDGSIGRPAGLAAGATDPIPPRVLYSYRRAEATLAGSEESPKCKLPWWLLAGIGKVQSNHAAGGQVDANGTSTVRIVGPRLDGTTVGAELVRDTDKGALDGDLTFDRGVGPMLVVPQTWEKIGRDGNQDGRTDVSDSDDAALAVGTLLCSAGSDLSTPDGLAEGLVRLDDTPAFPADVLPWAAHYRAAVTPPAPTASSSPSASASSAPAPAAPTSGTTGAPAQAPTPAGPGFTTQPTTAPPSSSPPRVAPRPTATRTGAPARPAPQTGRPQAPTTPARPAPRTTTPRTTQPAPPTVAPPTRTPSRAPERTPERTPERPPERAPEQPPSQAETAEQRAPEAAPPVTEPSPAGRGADEPRRERSRDRSRTSGDGERGNGTERSERGRGGDRADSTDGGRGGRGGNGGGRGDGQSRDNG